MATEFIRLNWQLTGCDLEKARKKFGNLEMHGGRFDVNFSDGSSTTLTLDCVNDLHQNQVMFLLFKKRVFFFYTINAYLKNGKEFMQKENLWYTPGERIYEQDGDYEDFVLFKFSLDEYEKNFIVNQVINLQFVFTFRKFEQRNLTLQSICEAKIMQRVNLSNVLEIYALIINQNAKKIEEKCLSVFMLFFEDLMSSEEWMKLKPVLRNKITAKALLAKNEIFDPLEYVLDKEIQRYNYYEDEEEEDY